MDCISPQPPETIKSHCPANPSDLLALTLQSCLHPALFSACIFSGKYKEKVKKGFWRKSARERGHATDLVWGRGPAKAQAGLLLVGTVAGSPQPALPTPLCCSQPWTQASTDRSQSQTLQVIAQQTCIRNFSCFQALITLFASSHPT